MKALRIPVLAVVLMLAVAAPPRAQTSSETGAETGFEAIYAGLERVMADGIDNEKIFLYLSRALRRARATGTLEPDDAVFFAMLADVVRFDRRNPAYALQIVEDGLELIAGDPALDDFRSALQVSRSYALADLGRFDEAWALAQLILPGYRALSGDRYADDFARDAANWAKGELSQYNRAATDLARETLERAQALLDEGAYGRVLTQAAAALLPMGTDLAEDDVRGVNVEAEMLNAQALAGLGRPVASTNAWLRALGYMTRQPWQPGSAPQWWGTGPLGEQQTLAAFDIMDGIAAGAAVIGRADIERAALAVAAGLATTPRNRQSVLLRRARLAVLGDDSEAGLELIEQSRDAARAAGQVIDEVAAAFYLEIVRTGVQTRAGEVPDPGPLIAATRAMIALYDRYDLDQRDLFLSSAADELGRTPARAEALEFARQALDWRQQVQASRNDNGFGRDAARRQARGVIDSFLGAAHRSATEVRGQGRCAEPEAYVGCLITSGAAP